MNIFSHSVESWFSAIIDGTVGNQTNWNKPGKQQGSNDLSPMYMEKKNGNKVKQRQILYSDNRAQVPIGRGRSNEPKSRVNGPQWKDNSI